MLKIKRKNNTQKQSISLSSLIEFRIQKVIDRMKKLVKGYHQVQNKVDYETNNKIGNSLTKIENALTEIEKITEEENKKHIF